MRLNASYFSIILMAALMFRVCSGETLLKSFRIALASSAPLVNSLVASGAIDGAKANAIIADFDAGAGCGLTLQMDFNAIPKDLPKAEIKAKKFAAAQKALQCFRVIMDRQNFAANPRVKQVADIAEGVLASLVIFYGSGGASTAPAGVVQDTSCVVIANDEKDLEQQLKAKVNEIERLLKP